MNEIERMVRNNFPGPHNKTLRADIRAAIPSGNVQHLAKSYALNISGQAGLAAVQAMLDASNHEPY